MDVIYSIEARNTVLYNVLCDYYGLNAKTLQEETIGNIKTLEIKLVIALKYDFELKEISLVTIC